MRFLCALLIFVSFTTLGQINIHLKTGKVISTNFAYLFSSHKSYVQIEEGKKGQKIMISEVDHIEGPDDQGNNRYFKPVFLTKEIWTERGFTSDRIVIYHTDIVFGSSSATHKPKSCVYSKDGGPVRTLKLKQLKKDLGDCPASVEYLNKGKKIVRGQTLIYVASYSLIVAGIIKTVSDSSDDKGDGSEASKTPTISPMIYIGAAGAWIPFLMNDAKNEKYVEALKAYK